MAIDPRGRQGFQASDNADYRRKSVIEQAGNVVNPGWIFRRITLFYADRKFITIAFVHLAITSIIFTHFALLKFNSQKEKVPEVAPRYSWKIGVPTFEFGTMHAILFQLGMLPVTMCRLIISKASSTVFNDVIPFNEMLKCHIAIGYTLVFMLFCTIVVFLMFFGVNCSDGDDAFCAKFTSEIMITGYVIFGLFLTVAITSYLRRIIPYRVFYVLHHIVFLTYAVTIAHTLDHVQRNKGGRSQTFKWFTASILLYITDRAAMYFNNRYEAQVLPTSCTISNADGKKMVILKVKKPELFYFRPGQYVYIKIPTIDNIWHPFSVASSPTSDDVDFYIEVFGEGSWTNNLYEKFVKGDISPLEDKWDDDSEKEYVGETLVEIMGPYGTSLGDIQDYSHSLLIGSGTGIVPIMSLLQLHVDKLLALDRDQFIKEKNSHHKIITSLYQDQRATGSLFDLMLSGCKQRDIDDIFLSRKDAFWYILKYFIMFLGTLLGVLVFGFTISWNLLPFNLYDGMKEILFIGTLVFQVSFLCLTLVVQERDSMWVYIDIVFLILSGLADWNYFATDSWGNLASDDLFYFTILSLYMIFRFWTTLLKTKNNSIESANKRGKGIEVLEKVHLIWTTRSVTLISQMLEDFEECWELLVDRFGNEFAKEVLEISIFCTSKDEEGCKGLQLEVANGPLGELGVLNLHRPSFSKIFEAHTMKRILETDSPASRTLIAFCGSPALSHRVKEAKILNDLAMFIAGRDQHQMDLVIESYGGEKKKSSQKHQERKPEKSGAHVQSMSDEELASRRTKKASSRIKVGK